MAVAGVWLTRGGFVPWDKRRNIDVGHGLGIHGASWSRCPQDLTL